MLGPVLRDEVSSALRPFEHAMHPPLTSLRLSR